IRYKDPAELAIELRRLMERRLPLRNDSILGRLPDQDAVGAELRQANQWTKLISQSGALIGQLPPTPPTLRGLFGALLIKLVRRALFWYTPPLQNLSAAVSGALAAQARLLETVNEKMGALIEQQGQFPLEPPDLFSSKQVSQLLNDVRGMIKRSADEQANRLLNDVRDMIKGSVQDMINRSTDEQASRLLNEVRAMIDGNVQDMINRSTGEQAD